MRDVGCDINKADNKGATHLYIACEKGHEQVATLLPTAGYAILTRLKMEKQHHSISAYLRREECVGRITILETFLIVKPCFPLGVMQKAWGGHSLHITVGG